MAGLIPNVEIVTVEWLKAALSSDRVSTNLPSPQTVGTEGFVTIAAVGGAPDVETRMQHSTIQVDCWGYNDNSNKLPWAQTFQRAMQIKQAVETMQNFSVTTPEAYDDAYVHFVDVPTDFRRVPGDEAFARYSADLVLHWSIRGGGQ